MWSRVKRMWCGPRGEANRTRVSLVPGVVLYVLIAGVLFKVLGAAVLAHDGDSAEPLWVLPLAIIADIGLAAGLGLLFHGLCRFVRGPLPWIAASLLLSAHGFLLGASFMSQRLSGNPVTWQMMQGDMGATLGDHALLSPADTRLAFGTLAFALVLLPVMLVVGARFDALRRWTRPHMLAIVACASLALVALNDRFGPAMLGVDESPVIAFVESVFDAASGGEAAAAEGATLDREGWARLHRPLLPPRIPDVTPPRSGPAPRNVVIFLAEGIPYVHTTFGGVEEATPNLARRAKEHGVLFERFHSNWHASIQALFALGCSQYPTTDRRHRTICTLHPRIDCGELSEVLEANDVNAGLFHGGHFAFYDKLAFFGDRGYAATEDAASLAKQFPKRQTHSWGIDDRAVVDGTLAWIDSLPEGEPFGALLVPITAHYPYLTPPGFRGPFGQKDKEAKFRNAVAFGDEVFERLARGLEEWGLYEDTLVIWLADHGHSVQMPPRPTPGVRTFYQENLHVPLVLLNPRLFSTGSVSKRPGSLIDVVPTALDALGLPPDPRHLGQSLLSARYEPRRIFFGAFRRGAYVGLIEGDHKVVIKPGTDHAEYYDLRDDPGETTDLSEDHPRRMRLWRQDLNAFYEGMLTWIPSQPSRGTWVDLHARLLEEATIRVHRGPEVTECAPVAKGQHKKRPCDGMDAPILQEVVRRADRRALRCLDVVLPEDVTRVDVELESGTLGTLSGARVGLTGRTRQQAGKVDVRIRVDGSLAAEREVKAPGKFERQPLHAPKEHLAIELEPAPEHPERVCLVFSDRAWRNHPATGK